MKADERRGGRIMLGDAVHDFMRSSGLAARQSAGAVFSAWNDAAKSMLGVGAPAVRFQGGELLVEAASSAHLQELKSFVGESLRQEANRRLGAERILRVTFRIGTPS